MAGGCILSARYYYWRGVRVVEGGGLENRCGATHRGFESLPLRIYLSLTAVIVVWLNLKVNFWRGSRVAESGSLLRSCTLYRVPWVRIPPSPSGPVPIAQLDRALDCGSRGRRFKSSWAHLIADERIILVVL